MVSETPEVINCAGTDWIKQLSRLAVGYISVKCPPEIFLRLARWCWCGDIFKISNDKRSKNVACGVGLETTD